jgi:hypothetical protein
MKYGPIQIAKYNPAGQSSQRVVRAKREVCFRPPVSFQRPAFPTKITAPESSVGECIAASKASRLK